MEALLICHQDKSPEGCKHEGVILSEQRLQRQVEELQAKINHYRTIFGPEIEANENDGGLSNRLRVKGEEITRLRLEIECYQKVREYCRDLMTASDI